MSNNKPKSLLTSLFSRDPELTHAEIIHKMFDGYQPPLCLPVSGHPIGQSIDEAAMNMFAANPKATHMTVTAQQWADIVSILSRQVDRHGNHVRVPYVDIAIDRTNSVRAIELNAPRGPVKVIWNGKN